MSTFKSQQQEIDYVENLLKKVHNYDGLKKYIVDNYANVHPVNLTLDRLKQIKRNINTWKLKLKGIKEAAEIREYIGEAIADIDLRIEHKQEGPKNQKMVSAPKIKAPEIAAFCGLINRSGIMQKGSDNAAIYCKKVCDTFKIPYAPNARKEYATFEHTIPTRRFDKIKKQIFPLLDKAIIDKINKAIGN